MKVDIFTIRSKVDKTLIFAEGAQHSEYCSDFMLSKKWLSEDDLLMRVVRALAWHRRGDDYIFDGEIRHLLNDEFDLVSFALEEIEVN